MVIDSNYTFGGDHFVVYTNVELKCTTETKRKKGREKGR